MSSSNASETSECETDTEEVPNLPAMKSLFNYRYGRQFIDGNVWDDYQDNRSSAKKGLEGACKTHRGITSSQEELSIIDYEVGTNPACSSQEELSLLDFDDETKEDKDDSSTSSEEQETQLLTLQESLREALIDSYEMRKQLEENSKKNSTQVSDDKDLTMDGQRESSDAFMDAVSKHLENIRMEDGGLKEIPPGDNAIVNYILKSYDTEKGVESKTKAVGQEIEGQSKRSPDLEEVPLPSIPPGTQEASAGSTTKRQTMDEIMSSWDTSEEGNKAKNDSQPKPERPKSGLLGAIKKTGIQRDQSPEELLRSVELSWSTIPFTSSWEDINKKMVTEQKELPQRSKPQRKTVAKSDSSTNTKHSDFELWKEDGSDVVRLTPQNRDINQNLDSATCLYATQYPMLDKGSMTSDLEDYNTAPMEASMEILSGMFPDIQSEALADVLEKCKGDIHWAVNLLLDSPHNIDITLDRKPLEDASGIAVDSSSIPIENLVISDGKKTIKRRKDRKAAPSELSLMLKKQIEDSIRINEEYYEKNAYMKRQAEMNAECNAVQNSFADPSQTQEFDSTRMYESEYPSTFAQVSHSPQDDEDEEEETIPMKIDPEFFRQLASHFGHTVERERLEGPHSVSVINIPLSLGYQIYSSWLETVNRQIEDIQAAYDNMIKEDELLAKALQQQEQDQHKPDLREIMDMELAMALYKQDEALNRGNIEETVASKLSIQLLNEAFPNVDRKVILDAFRCKGCSFQKTVDFLKSLKGDSSKTVPAPEFLQAYEKKLIRQAEEESAKREAETPRKPIVVVKQKNTKKSAADTNDVLVVNPAEFRENMSRLQKRRIDCCKQAQEAFRNKSYSVASYYSYIASLYKERIAEINRKSISLKLFDEEKNEVSPRLLDLHFLFVPEAVQIADMFLDHHISELSRRNLSSLDLFLITGRGQKSRFNKPKIKPAIKKRLQQRNIA
ncbi:UNVERIFIED_CONTAM: hypothetical protein PYX00_004050 [Menopon gallinae]